jgi:hypothetical protein
LAGDFCPGLLFYGAKKEVRAVTDNEFDIEQKLALRLPQIEAATGLTIHFLRKEIWAGRLPAYKRNNVLYVLADDLKFYLRSGKKVEARKKTESV